MGIFEGQRYHLQLKLKHNPDSPVRCGEGAGRRQGQLAVDGGFWEAVATGSSEGSALSPALKAQQASTYVTGTFPLPEPIPTHTYGF